MSVFVIGDLHLALSTDKPMDIFRGWDGYMERLEQSWRDNITDSDTVVIAGDVSWALKLDDTLADFAFLEQLPGRKLLMKGNHDYWWSTRAKAESFFDRHGLRTLDLLHNNAACVDGVYLCGSRGWMFENGATHDRKIVEREACRIEMSLATAPIDAPKVLLLHYPPIFGTQVIPEFFALMERYGVRQCYYGHLHGSAIAAAFEGNHRGVELRLISADALAFSPLKIL